MTNAMRRTFSLVMCAFMVAGMVGCGSSEADSKPNPDLKVPDVPAGGHGSKDKAMTAPKK